MKNLHRLIYIFLLASFIGLSSLWTLRPIRAASVSLVWKPYLQQLTDTSVIILWVTQTGGNPEVRYSTDTSYNLVATGSTRLVWGAKLHRVELMGLQSHTPYNYKIYTDSQDMLPSETLWFQTAPSKDGNTPFKFIVFGDYGWNSTSQKQLRDRMLLDSFDFILTTGDNAYYNGTYAEFDTNVFDIYQDLFSHAGFFPTLGNHDYRTNSGAPYLDIFDLPDNAWRTNDHERYYTFDFGNVHVVALDSNTPLDENDGTANNDMFDWLRSDLGQTTQPWKIVAFHHAAYSTGPHGPDTDVQTKLVPIFEEYGVDLVFNGHDHIYERSHPLKNGQVSTGAAGGVIYIISGAGSAANYGCGGAYWQAIAYCAQSYGLYSRVTVNSNTLTIEAVDQNGTIRDSYAINKSLDSPVTDVDIIGPSGGLADFGVNLMAKTSPITVTPPITYVWQATGQLPQTSVSGLINHATFTWTQTGTQMITVTAINNWGISTNTYNLTINPIVSSVHLPLILKP
jgi:3',5'-cyclic AMP phosphodiesterase CpdA